jgi:hypothetical protein
MTESFVLDPYEDLALVNRYGADRRRVEVTR